MMFFLFIVSSCSKDEDFEDDKYSDQIATPRSKTSNLFDLSKLKIRHTIEQEQLISIIKNKTISLYPSLTTDEFVEGVGQLVWEGI